METALRVRTADVQSEDSKTFDDLHLPKHIVSALSGAGFTAPSPVQRAAIPLGCIGSDLIVQAKSGTGKTVVFAVICLSRVKADNTSLQGASNSKLCHIAVGTPGRVLSLLQSGSMVAEGIKMFVLDEADALLSESFYSDVTFIYDQMPRRKQVMAFSATYTKDLLDDLEPLVKKPQRVMLCEETVSLVGVKQFYGLVGEEGTRGAALGSESVPGADGLVACSGAAEDGEEKAKTFRQKVEKLLKLIASVSFHQPQAEWLATRLTAAGYPSAYLSGARPQNERMEAMEAVRGFQLRVLVSTDVVARGVDLDRVNLVVNLDLPVGRTGRFGTRGVSISLVTASELLNLQAYLTEASGGEATPLPDVLPDDLYSYKLTSDWEKEAFEKLKAAPKAEAPPEEYKPKGDQDKKGEDPLQEQSAGQTHHPSATGYQQQQQQQYYDSYAKSYYDQLATSHSRPTSTSHNQGEHAAAAQAAALSSYYYAPAAYSSAAHQPTPTATPPGVAQPAARSAGVESVQYPTATAYAARSSGQGHDPRTGSDSDSGELVGLDVLRGKVVGVTAVGADKGLASAGDTEEGTVADVTALSSCSSMDVPDDSDMEGYAVKLLEGLTVGPQVKEAKVPKPEHAVHMNSWYETPSGDEAQVAGSGAPVSEEERLAAWTAYYQQQGWDTAYNPQSQYPHPPHAPAAHAVDPPPPPPPPYALHSAPLPSPYVHWPYSSADTCPPPPPPHHHAAHHHPPPNPPFYNLPSPHHQQSESYAMLSHWYSQLAQSAYASAAMYPPPSSPYGRAGCPMCFPQPTSHPLMQSPQLASYPMHGQHAVLRDFSTKYAAWREQYAQWHEQYTQWTKDQAEEQRK
eukprot:gene8552-33985_t